MRCMGTTLAGKRCKNKAMPHSRYCQSHRLKVRSEESGAHGLIFTDALYYPFIEIPDETWLRTAALYWNTISTIVPESVTPYRIGDAKPLSDAGVLQPLVVHPGMPEVGEVAEEVLDYLYTEEGRRALFPTANEFYSRIHNEKFWHMFRHRLRDMAQLHFRKLSPDLSNLLQRKRHRTQSRDPWVRVPASFAAYYMTLLATRLALSKGRALLTDNIASEALAARASLGDVPSVELQTKPVPSTVAEGILATIVLQTVKIDRETPMSKILSFREKHEVELAELRTAVRDLLNGFSAPVTPEALASHLQSVYRDKVTPAVENLRGKLRGHRVTLGFNSLKASALLSASPTAVGAALSSVGLGPVALAAGAGLSVVLQIANYRIQRREILRSSPFSYLLAAERDFGARKPQRPRR